MLSSTIRQLRARRSLTLFSALLVLNGTSLNSPKALLVLILSRRIVYKSVRICVCVCVGGGGCNRLQPWTFSINITIQPRTYLPGGDGSRF